MNQPVTKRFHIGDILSVTTGRLVSLDHMRGIYRILGFMTGESLFTHQLPRACDEASPYLLDQFPELRNVDLPDEFVDEQHVKRWLSLQAAIFGEWFEIRPIPEIARVPHDPFVEAEKMMRP